MNIKSKINVRPNLDAKRWGGKNLHRLIAKVCELFSHAGIVSARYFDNTKRSFRYWRKHRRTFWKRQLSTTAITLGLFLLFSSIAPMLVSAVTFTDISVPNGDVSTTGWSAVGTNDSSCASGTLCNYVDEGSTADTADYVQAPASGAGGELLTLDMENTSVGDGAMELTFYVNARAINDANGAADSLDLRLAINGTDLATTSQPLTTTYTWYTVTYTGSWTQADIDSMQAKMTRQYQGGGNPNSRTDDTQIAATYVDITYEQSSTFEQSAYRWFENDGTIAITDWTQATSSAGWSNRSSHATVTFKGKMWVLGGYDGTNLGDVWSSSDGTNWNLETSNPGWEARRSLAATVFDNKIWIMGGCGASCYRNDVWYSSDGVNWTEATSAAGWTGRMGHTVLTHRGKMWVMGGRTSAFSNDVWYSSDGVNWTEATSAAGWAARSYQAGEVHDGSMWIYGGDTDTGYKDDVWKSTDGITWTELTADAVEGYTRQNATLTSYGGKLWIMGGTTGAYEDEVYSSSDGASWTTVTLAANWSGRDAHTAAALNNKLWIMGGKADASVVYRDVWYYQENANIGASLAAQDTATTAPNEGTPFRLRSNVHVGVAELPANSATFKLQYAQQGSDAVCDLSFTGESYVDVPDPGATVSGEWTEENGNAPWTARNGNELVELNGTLYILGGYGGTGAGYFNDVWSSTDGVTWTQETSNAAWPARMDHSAVVYNNKIWLFGGFDGGTSYDDVWSSSDGQTWTLETDAPGWSGRSMHTSEVFAGKMWIIGGFNGSADLSDVWSSTDGVTWTQETASAGWTARSEHATFLLDDKMFISGGYNLRNDVWSTTDGVTWTQETAGASWSGRYEHTATTVNGTVWLMGGYNGSTHLNDVWTSTDGATWTQQSDAPWEPRGYFESIFFDNKLWIQGGYDNPDRYNDTWSSPLEYPDISFHDNTNITDGMALSSSTEDPVHNSDTSVAQSYVESNTFTNPYAIPNGQDGLWDFSLVDNNAPGDTSYCFRIVNSDGAELNTYSSIAEIKTQPPVLTQSDYRWFENQDKTPNFGAEGVVFRNPTTGTDAAYATAKDNEYLYVAGYYSANGNDWYVQKQRLSDGALCSAGACGTEFGGNGVVTINPSSGDDRIHSIAVDESSIYLAGYDTAPGNIQWRIEKRDKSTGALDTNFGTNGVITYNYGSLDDKAHSIAIHGDYLFIAGYEGIATGDTQARVEKRSKTSGALCDGAAGCSDGQFATSGYYRYDLSGTQEYPAAITVDSSGVYFAGQHNDVEILVRSLDLVGGTVASSSIFNITAGQADSVAFNGITVDSDYVYVGGQAGDMGSDAGWWVSKHNKSTLNLCSSSTECAAGAFDGDGLLELQPSANDDLVTGLAVDTTSLYAIGTDRSQDTGMARYLMQKRDKADGSLDTSFGTNGEVTYNPSTSHDEPRGMVIDNDYAWIVGYDAVPGNYEINVQKRKLSDGSLVGGGNWLEVASAAGWSGRTDFAAMSYNDKLWVMGGTPDGSTRLNDVWSSLDGVSWTQEDSAANWSTRVAPYNVVHDGKMWILGGYSGISQINDAWYSTDGVSWTQASSGPWSSGRSDGGAASFDGRMYVAGGYAGSSTIQEVWSSADGVSWTQETTPGWAGRSDIENTTVTYDNKLWVMSGSSNGSTSGVLNDVWYTTDGSTWTQATSSAPWEARMDAVATVYDGKLWIMGGQNSAGSNLNDVWWTVDGENWTQAENASWAARRAFEGFEHSDGSMWIMGGIAGSRVNDVWKLESDTSVLVGPTLSSQSTLYESESYDELVRLRSLVAITNKPAASGSFKLQYAPRFGQCDTGFTGENYTDVPGSYMAYFDNTLAADGDSIEPSTNDPTNGNTNILQSYVEANNFSLNAAVGRSENALWDFALKETGTSGGSYCFRIVHSDSSLLDSYTHIPELGVPAHTPQQLRHGRYFDTAQQARPFYW